MTIRLTLTASLCTIFLINPISGQTQTPEEKDEDRPTRTLRVMVTGVRPLPVYKRNGDKYVEVEPPLRLMPPTSVAFAEPAHIPKPKNKDEPAALNYSAWPNQLVRIDNYNGPSTLPLLLRRPLIQDAADQQVTCNLGKSTQPLILLHASANAEAWSSPHATIIDMSPEKTPAHSAVIVNFSPRPLAVYFTTKPVFIQPNGHATIKIPTSDKDSIRYRIDTKVDNKVVTVTNSSYRLEKNTRLIMIASPAQGNVKTNPLDFRIINDPL